MTETLGPHNYWTTTRGSFHDPADIADAVRHAITRPAHVDVAEVVVRPDRDLDAA